MKHGYYVSYNRGCTCEPCTRDASKRRNINRLRLAEGKGRIPSYRFKRRVHALQAIGWRLDDIAADMGLPRGREHLSPYLHPDRKWVTWATWELIDATYRRMSMTPGPSEKVRRIAESKGWPPPLAYEDIDNPDPKEDEMAREYSGLKLTRWNTFEDRFWGRVDKSGECWVWTGKLDAKGYGAKVGYEGVSHRPHRLSYELLRGPIPDGLVIDHLCRNRACVNPDHLEPVTAIENTRRGVEARWSEPCANGHDSKHRRTLPSGKNFCTECRRQADARRDGANRDARRAAARQRYARKGRADRGADPEEWLFLVQGGVDGHAAADRLGVTLGAIERSAMRKGLDHIARAARRAEGHKERSAA